MADNDPNVTASSKAEMMTDLGARLNDHPRLKKLIIVQTFVLIILAMVFVGGLAMKTTQVLTADPESTESSSAQSDNQREAALAPGTQPVMPKGRDFLLAGVRPDGATLIGVSEAKGGLLLLHFRTDRADVIVRVDPKSGAYDRVAIP